MGKTDEKLYVPEPEKPIQSVTACRIALEDNVLINKEVDPQLSFYASRMLFSGHVIRELTQTGNPGIHLKGLGPV